MTTQDPIVIVGMARTPMGGFQGDLAAASASGPLRGADVANIDTGGKQRASEVGAVGTRALDRDQDPGLSAAPDPSQCAAEAVRRGRERRQIEAAAGARFQHGIGVCSCMRIYADDMVIMISHGAHSDGPLPVGEQCSSSVWRRFEAELS